MLALLGGWLAVLAMPALLPGYFVWLDKLASLLAGWLVFYAGMLPGHVGWLCLLAVCLWRQYWMYMLAVLAGYTGLLWWITWLVLHALCTNWLAMFSMDFRYLFWL
jgi:hypothetical protein